MGHAVEKLEDAQSPEVRLNSCLISQRLLSKRSTFELNRDAALTEWRSLIASFNPCSQGF